MNSDFTAVCVSEVWSRVRADAPTPPAPFSADELERETFYVVRYLARLPHGLSWIEMDAAIVAILAGLYDEEAQRLATFNGLGDLDDRPAMLPRSLYADRTGLGDAAVEMLAIALGDEPRTRAVEVVPLSFVAGEKFDRVRGVIGKLRLISRLQALLATRPTRVDLPKHDPQIPVLLAELDAYKYTLHPDTGHETLGGEGEHDDLVTALALSVVDDPRDYMMGAIKLEAAGW